MSVIFMDGAEDMIGHQKWTFVGTFANPNRGAPANRFGSVGLDPGRGFGSAIYWVSPAADEHATWIAGFAYNWNAAGLATSVASLRSDSAGTEHIRMAADTAGRVQLYAGGVLRATSDIVLVTGAWNYFELKGTLADSGGLAELRMNGVTLLTFTGDTKNGGTKTVFDSFYLHETPSSSGPEHYMDDVVILNGAGSVNNDYIGDCVVEAHYPNGNGFHSDLLGSDGNSTNNYLLVDEAGTPNTADYVGSAIVGEQDTYTFDNLVQGGSVAAVFVRPYARKSDTGTRQLRTVTRSANVDAYGSDTVLSQTWAPLVEKLNVNPVSGAAWTRSDFDNAEFGIQVRA